MQRIVETAKAEAARKRDPLNALIDALGLLPGGQPVALAADTAAQGKHPWKRDVGREIDRFAEGVGEAIRNPADALEVAASEAPADWLGVGMRGHTRGEKPGGDLLMQLGAALGIANATPKPKPRVDVPRAPRATASKPLYPEKPLKTRTTPGTRTGAIPLDDAAVKDLVDALYGDPWEPGRRPAFGEVDVPLADGGRVRASASRLPMGGPQGRATWDPYPDGRIEPRVTIDVPGGDPSKIRQTIEHELAHIADPGLRKRYERMAAGEKVRPYANDGGVEYANQAHEVTARIREMHRALADESNYIRKMERPRADEVLAGLGVEPYWRHHEAMTPGNKKRMLRAAQDTIDAILEGRVAEVSPRKPPPWVHDGRGPP